jgi:hypothetical protein
MIAARPQAGDVARGHIHEDARPVDDPGLRRIGERNFDHVDAEERRVGVLFRITHRATGKLVAGTDLAGARSVDVEIRLVGRQADDRVRVRAAARLHRAHLLRLADVLDVEDADAAEALGARRRRHTLHAAVDTAARLFHRHDQQVAPDRHVALAARARHGGDHPRLVRPFDVVGLEAVEVADEHMRAAERDV